MQNNKPGQKQAKVLVPGAWEKAIKQYLIARKKDACVVLSEHFKQVGFISC